MESFDIVHHPLTEGTCLIEAGAGTGKTYALTAVFLRLLFEKQLEPERILVVTFTTAATAELRERLRRQLVAVRRFVDGEGPLDDTLQKIVAKTGAPTKIRQRVVAALREFDHFAVFTIHGFCQRLLGELAFETASPFEIELLTDPSEWIQGIADDFWREVFFETAPELADYAFDKLRGPESLAALYQRYRMPDLRLIPELPQLPPVDFAPYRRCCKKLSRQWPAVRSDIGSLLQSPALKGNIYGSLKPATGAPPAVTKRAQKVEDWCRSLDYFLRREPTLFPPCPTLIYFTAAKVAASTRKGQTPPAHAFFSDGQELHTAAQKLQRELDEWLTALRFGFFTYADRKLKQQKQDRQAVFFDDLLVQVHGTLEGKRGDRLATAVRRRYQVALVDEFQDTDTIQYQIFKRLFDTGKHLLFMIGDPKQAIYGFRGADIFSYLQAVRQADQQRTLVQNWRSQPALIKAINTLFTNRPHPFLIPEIAYHPAVAAPGKDVEAAGRLAGSPMIFWRIPAGDADGPAPVRPLTKNGVAQKVLAAIAVEAKRLLGLPLNATEGAAGFSARDIAVLVRTNRQARMVKACLQEAGIPSVIQNAGNVFDTAEADAFEHVLRAVVNPGDTRRLKTALATRFFGYGGDQLAFADQGPDWWEDERKRFFSYQAMWQKSGFFPFFRRLLSENRIAERLLCLTDGERRLTNLLHLGELLHQATASMHGALREALKWLDRQKTMLSGSLDEQLLRMESDARAITILTVHKSKGLEFPIVFCPFSWESDSVRNEWPLFHDREAGMRRTLDLRIDVRADHQNQARQERMAESLRLLYVAITRARTRCYLVWGDELPSAGASALGYLLTSAVNKRDGHPNPDERPAVTDGLLPAEKPDNGLTRLERKSGGTITVSPLPDMVLLQDTHEIQGPELAHERYMRRRLDFRWAIASFSSLIRAAATAGPSPADHDQGTSAIVLPGAIGSEKDHDTQKLADDMHLFPRGAHAGNLFHRLFEILDYSQTRSPGWQGRIESELMQHGFEHKWVLPVTRLIQNVLTTPLPSTASPFSLNRLTSQACIKELPFTFPLNRIDAEKLSAVFDHHDLPLPREVVAQHSKRLKFNISGGYLRGFIDLVFRAQGRYYLLDWKSNLLGETYADYWPDRINTVMAEDYYFLQYHLYVVALDQFLRLRLPEYEYERDFGGVYYLFIRGMRPNHGARSGIFHDRPEAGLVADLRKLLLKDGQCVSLSAEGEGA